MSGILMRLARRRSSSREPAVTLAGHDCSGSFCCTKSGRSCRLVIQNTKPIRRKNTSTVTETTFVAKPSVGVNASTEVSRMTP